MTTTKRLSIAGLMMLGLLLGGAFTSAPAEAATVHGRTFQNDPPGNAYAQGSMLLRSDGGFTVDISHIRDAGPSGNWAALQVRACRTAVNCTGWITIYSTPSASWQNPAPITRYWPDGGAINHLTVRTCNDQRQCSPQSPWLSRY